MKLNILLLLTIIIHTKEIIKNFTITDGIISLFGYKNKGILINGQYPGPEIHLNDEDLLILNVNNKLNNKNLTLHFHGISQKGSSSQDGVPMVTQYPIIPNSKFQYKFSPKGQSGTYYYHAHTDLNDIWLYGPLIIHESKKMRKELINYNPSYYYDEERIITISDSWLNPNEILMDGLLNSPIKWVNNSYSLLINGQTYSEKNEELKNKQLEIKKLFKNDFDQLDYFETLNEYPIIDVQPNKIYRLRIIAATDFNQARFFIPGHKLTIISVDGFYIEPKEVNYIHINSGQRYSVLLHTNQIPNNYFIFSEALDRIRNSPARSGIAILHYQHSSLTTNIFNLNKLKTLNYDQIMNSYPLSINRTKVDPMALQWKSSELTPSSWYLSKSSKKFNHLFYSVPQKINKEITLNGIETFNSDMSMNWKINNRIYHDPEIPWLNQLNSIKNLSTSILNNNTNGVYEYFEGQNIQVIIQNNIGSTTWCDEHPWHLHGHTFHIVGSGPGKYNSSIDGKQIEDNVKNGKTVFRDTTTVFAYDIKGVSPIDQKERLYPMGTPCGWTALRFRADNPGAWLMHCHITPHVVMKKKVVFIEKPLN